jgi:hypothetical protein
MKYSEQFKKHKYLTDKCGPHTYGTEVYDDLFEPIQHTVKNYLEVGSAYGGSALLARDYFTGATIWTADIEQPNWRMNRGERIIHVMSDAYTKKVADMFPAQMDIIIDDGSHFIQHQCKMIELYLEKLLPLGYFIIEDVQNHEVNFPILEKEVDKFLQRYKGSKNMWLDFEITTYVGPEYIKEGPQYEDPGSLTKPGTKSKDDNLYILQRTA